MGDVADTSNVVIEDFQEMKICPYCGERKQLSEFTKEHVIPKAIGGVLTPTNPFLLHVCRHCNSSCGLYVDEPFVKSFLIKNEYAQMMIEYASTEETKTIPFTYMGKSEDWTDPSCECELWHGPAGDHIFHFHKPYPAESAFAIVGKPAFLKADSVDAGTVIVSFVATNDFWVRLIMRSLKVNFKNSRFIFTNLAPSKKMVPYDPKQQTTVTDEPDITRYQWVKSLGNKERNCTLEMCAYASDRFLYKLALGFGALFLNASFVESTDAANLRRGLWSRTHEDRAGLGATLCYAPENFKEISEILSIKTSHVFTIKCISSYSHPPILFLYASFFGKYPLTCIISQTPSHWENKFCNSSGSAVSYVVSPGLKTCVGPIPFAELLNHKLTPISSPVLGDIEKQLSLIPPTPPFQRP